MTGPFLMVRILSATSYVTDAGGRPTSEARKYLLYRGDGDPHLVSFQGPPSYYRLLPPILGISYAESDVKIEGLPHGIA